jgi:hypothetical protein
MPPLFMSSVAMIPIAMVRVLTNHPTSSTNCILCHYYAQVRVLTNHPTPMPMPWFVSLLHHCAYICILTLRSGSCPHEPPNTYAYALVCVTTTSLCLHSYPHESSNTPNTYAQVRVLTNHPTLQAPIAFCVTTTSLCLHFTLRFVSSRTIQHFKHQLHSS